MDDRIHVSHRPVQARTGREIALHPVGAGAGLAAEHPNAVARAAEIDHDLAAEGAGAAGDQHVHRAQFSLRDWPMGQSGRLITSAGSCRPRSLGSSLAVTVTVS